MTQPTHKSLQSTFAAPPPRGNKLQGLLRPTPPRGPQPSPDVHEQDAPDSPTDAAAPQAPQTSTTTAPQITQPPAAPTQSAPARAARTGKPAPTETGPTSVYLHTKAYRELVDRRQKRFRSYAQTVYDAFAYIRDKAKDEHKNPAEALAKLFEMSDATDPWLMPEPRSARNSAEPTVEAKIALKPQERQWVKDRMAEIGATHLSPFLATVLEHYLLHAKS
ncbi:hypothetical protein MSIMFB_04431 [Mycobacterium simulans]|uniref:Uncharacterized protein n=1 Tax=Mycobacterium simulans TaxID=627089 RepID=A0A7Z7INL5_9MYCO|nr:hypothetical protein MSIMFB_04431 [Mycobacterium simulans]